MTSSTPTWARPLEPVRLLLVALQFLTRIPVRSVPVGGDDLRRATAAFPLVGLLVGVVVTAVRLGAEPLLGPVAATILAVGAGVAVTGAFHEDGLADTVDGLWGGWSPSQRVEIMRDSRLGTYGAVALLVALALQTALLAELPGAVFAVGVIVGHVLGRAAVLVMIRALPAYHDQGSGAAVAEPVGGVGQLVAGTTVAMVGVPALGPWLLVPLATGAVAGAWLRRETRRRIGGLTGDVLGATQQLVLLSTVGSVAALHRLGHLSGAWAWS